MSIMSTMSIMSEKESRLIWKACASSMTKEVVPFLKVETVELKFPSRDLYDNLLKELERNFEDLKEARFPLLFSDCLSEVSSETLEENRVLNVLYRDSTGDIELLCNDELGEWRIRLKRSLASTWLHCLLIGKVRSLEEGVKVTELVVSVFSYDLKDFSDEDSFLEYECKEKEYLCKKGLEDEVILDVYSFSMTGMYRLDHSVLGHKFHMFYGKHSEGLELLLELDGDLLEKVFSILKSGSVYELNELLLVEWDKVSTYLVEDELTSFYFKLERGVIKNCVFFIYLIFGINESQVP